MTTPSEKHLNLFFMLNGVECRVAFLHRAESTIPIILHVTSVVFIRDYPNGHQEASGMES